MKTPKGSLLAELVRQNKKRVCQLPSVELNGLECQPLEDAKSI